MSSIILLQLYLANKVTNYIYAVSQATVHIDLRMETAKMSHDFAEGPRIPVTTLGNVNINVVLPTG
jgi:hypothetical protein